MIALVLCIYYPWCNTCVFFNHVHINKCNIYVGNAGRIFKVIQKGILEFECLLFIIKIIINRSGIKRNKGNQPSSLKLVVTRERRAFEWWAQNETWQNHVLSKKRRVLFSSPTYIMQTHAFSLRGEIDSGGVCIKNGIAIKVKKVTSLRVFYGGSLPGRVKGVRYANYSSRDARKKN